MPRFVTGHATHPDWRMALALAAAQIDAGRAAGPEPMTPTLGFVYLGDAYAPQAEALLAELRARWPGVAWVGSVGIGVLAGGVEYFDEPALALMLADLPPAEFEVFSGVRPLQRIAAFSALVHADPSTPELGELIGEMSERTLSGYLFGGLTSSRTVALHIADGAWQGGLSGVAFGRGVGLLSRVTQGCQPVGPVRTITRCEGNIVQELDGEPALPCLLRDIGLDADRDPRQALPRLRATLAGLTGADEQAVGRGGQFGPDVRVRHLVGIDPGRRAVAVADLVEPGMRLAFCSRDVDAARRDLVRICSEIRDELDPAGDAPPRRIAGAVYVSCSGRGGPHFGGDSAEMQIVRHALGDVPLVGFFAGGEIAHRHLYGYTGVLTVFTDEGEPGR